MRAVLTTLPLLAACQQDIFYEFQNEIVEAPPNPPNLSAPMQEDVFRQRIPEKVDILWIIDNSSSMLGEQHKLADNFASFLVYYRNSGLDWQIGVVSTDMTDTNHQGKLQGAAGFRWVDPTVPDPVGVFSQMAVLGNGGSAREQGLRAAMTALSEPLISTFNAGFYRPDALLSFIAVSDENDLSDGVTPNQFINWALNLKGDPEMVNFSAIVGLDTECTDRASDDFIEASNGLGGVAYSICTRDWTPILEAIGIRAAGLQREFVLTEVPDVDTLEVFIEDEGAEYTFERGVDYIYDGDANSIIFQRYTPRATAYVHMRYELLQ